MLEKTMRTLSLLFAVLAFVPCLADDRPTMKPSSPDHEAVRELMDKISESCSRRDFMNFICCFTPERAASIRRRAEDIFIMGHVNLDVVDFFVISSDEQSLSFGLNYTWEGPGGKVTYYSKVVAKRTDDDLLIDSEQIKHKKSLAPPPSKFAKADCPGGMCNVPAPNCPGGVCNVPAPKWRAPNPANGGEEAWLPKDILYTPGPSCANGNCGFK